MDERHRESRFVQRIGDRLAIELALRSVHSHVGSKDVRDIAVPDIAVPDIAVPDIAVPDIAGPAAIRTSKATLWARCRRSNSRSQRQVSVRAQLGDETGHFPPGHLSHDSFSFAYQRLGCVRLELDCGVVDLRWHLGFVSKCDHPPLDHLGRDKVTTDSDGDSPAGMRPKAQRDMHD